MGSIFKTNTTRNEPAEEKRHGQGKV
jgi:hypothetical protein